jgi:hypothetical protein
MLLASLLLGAPFVVQASDARLDAIRALLLPMRSADFSGNKVRGATPATTAVKHQLREWIEPRLSPLQWNGVRWTPDPIVLQEQLNDELTREGLFCVSEWKGCESRTPLGFLGRIVLDMRSGVLVAKTAVGIECGYDESAYAYEQNAGSKEWRKFWQTEQDDYAEGKYFPQILDQVKISRFGADGRERLILTLGTEPWCSGNWHDLYYRVWQTKQTNDESILLLSGSELAAVSAPINGSAYPNGVVFEHYVQSVEGGFTRPEIGHYILKKGKLERGDPVALGPQDFTAFWLRHPWPESSHWTAVASRSQLEQWRKQHQGPFSEFGSPSLHCALEPDLWQVDTDADEEGKEHVYFLMRWRPPYHFTMQSVSDHPRPDCKEKDVEADDLHSLFPTQ